MRLRQDDFELHKVGRVNKKVYKYDLNSAHPSTIALLPSMRNEWKHVIEPQTVRPYGIYRIEYNSIRSAYEHNRNDVVLWPHPFHVRDRRSLIFYPAAMEGWRWAPEILTAREFLSQVGAELYIAEGWELQDDGSRPFEFVYDMYRQRQLLKSQGNVMQLAFKLGLNSLFGKTAQRAGWRPGREIPQYHQLEWAGYITSGTRARLWPALWQAYCKGSLIGCETDAVLSSEPLDLPLSKKLGEWDYEEYDDAIYLQNGIYWLKDGNKWKAKFRGLDKESLSYDDAMRFLERIDLREPYSTDWSTNHGPLVGETTRFIGGRMAMRTDMERWRCWTTDPRRVMIGTQGKRVHDPAFCVACSGDYQPPSETTHNLIISAIAGVKDHQHNVPWRVPERVADRWPLPEEVSMV
jgi:hypothetical protein